MESIYLNLDYYAIEFNNAVALTGTLGSAADTILSLLIN